MIPVGELGAAVIALLAMLPLTLGLVSLVIVRDRQLQVHAMSLAGTGPLVLLLSAVAWGDGRTVVTALVLAAVLLVTTGMSGHAIMRLLAARAEWRSERRDDAPGAGRGATGGNGRE